MIDYTLGFAFNKEMNRVILIKKNRPSWQAGLLNGVGGKVESWDASPPAAQAREFREETGIETTPGEWKLFASLNGDDFLVDCFWTTLDDQRFYDYESVTDEAVNQYSLIELQAFQTCPNVPMLIAMCRNLDVQSNRFKHIELTYK